MLQRMMDRTPLMRGLMQGWMTSPAVSNIFLDTLLHGWYIHSVMQNNYSNIDWKVIPRGDVAPHWAGLYATMNKKGGIVVSGITHERLGSPDAYLIMFDQ